MTIANPIAGNQPTKTPPQPGRPQHSKRLSDVEGQFIISTQNPKSKDESLHPGMGNHRMVHLIPR